MAGAAIAGLIATLAAVGPATPHARAAATTDTHGIRHVWEIDLENENEATSFAPGSYLADTLVPQAVFLPNYYATGHVSLDNYIAQISGQMGNPDTHGDCIVYKDFVGTTTADGVPAGAGCVYPASVPTLADQLAANGRTWHGYMDDMGNTVNAAGQPTREMPRCGQPVGATPGQPASSTPPGTRDGTQTATTTDQYAARHNPFVYFHSLVDVPVGKTTSPCTDNVVPLVKGAAPGVNGLAEDLQLVDPPAFNFITPNLCNDGHDGPCAGYDVNGSNVGGLTSANAFLQKYVPMIEASPAYQADGLIVVTFDEASPASDHSSCCGQIGGSSGVLPAGGGGRVGALLISPRLTPHTSTCAYNHYSALRSFEDIFGIKTGGADGQGHLGQAAGANAFGIDVYGGSDTCWSQPSPVPQPNFVVVAGPGAAFGAFATPVVVMTKGAALTFVNFDGLTSQHTVTSVIEDSAGHPLFNSGFVPSGTTAPVAGVSSLDPGSYAFYCIRHPGMTGTLVVQ